MKTNFLLPLFLVFFCSTLHAQRHKQDWVNYVIQKEKGTMAVSSNLYYSYSAKPNYKNLMLVGTSTKKCHKNGYPDYFGLAKFYAFSDSIGTKIEKVTKSRLVGVLTYQCSGFDVYYVKDTTNLRSTIKEYIDNNYVLSKNYIHIKPDKKWNYYKENLLPKDISDSFFTNHEFLTKLMKDGDDFTKSRKVSHWINFRNDKKRQEFIKKIKTIKFAVNTLSFEKENAYKYQVKISKNDIVTPEYISELTKGLSLIAKNYNGIYDGWGAEAIKED